MSNEERIKGWRNRRQDQNYAVGTGVAAWRLDVGALFDNSTAPAAVLKQLLARLQGEKHDTVAARRTVYDVVLAELDKEAARRGLAETYVDFARRRLRIMLRLLEQDIRAGVDVYARGYMPPALAAEDERLGAAHERRERRRKQDEIRDARRHASRNDIALEIELSAV
jgi:hypothetical protein